MPFNVGETIFAWTHILKGFDRRLKNQPRDRFLQYFQSQGLPISAVLYEGNAQFCQLCGYSMAALSLSEGWTMHACSAINFAKILNNQKHSEWLKTLSRAQLNRETNLRTDKDISANSVAAPAATTSLPTAGV